MKQLEKAGVMVLLAAGLVWAEEPPPPAADKEISCNTGAGCTNSPPGSVSPAEIACLADSAFESSDLRIKISKETATEKLEEDIINSDWRSLEKVVFKVTLENGSTVPITGIQLDGRSFYHTNIKCGSDIGGGSAFKKELVSVSSLAPGEIRTVSLRPLILRKVAFQTPDTVDANGEVVKPGAPTTYVRDFFAGVRILLTRTNRYGKVVTRMIEDGRPPSGERLEQYRPDR
jgi:hypothetical protein